MRWSSGSRRMRAAGWPGIFLPAWVCLRASSQIDFTRVIAVESAPASIAALAHNLRGTSATAVKAATLEFLRRERSRERPDLDHCLTRPAPAWARKPRRCSRKLPRPKSFMSHATRQRWRAIYARSSILAAGPATSSTRSLSLTSSRKLSILKPWCACADSGARLGFGARGFGS